MPNPASALALILSLCLSLGAALPVSAMTEPDISHGAQLFSSNCAACHMGGGNVIRANRTLRQADLQSYLDSYSQHPIEAIEHQIENGKNAMPSYGGRLSLTEIDDVAAFVEKQAEKGWSR